MNEPKLCLLTIPLEKLNGQHMKTLLQWTHQTLYKDKGFSILPVALAKEKQNQLRHHAYQSLVEYLVDER
eukprot:4870132-Ditylum_brightwellii.AAC.1